MNVKDKLLANSHTPEETAIARALLDLGADEGKLTKAREAGLSWADIRDGINEGGVDSLAGRKPSKAQAKAPVPETFAERQHRAPTDQSGYKASKGQPEEEAAIRASREPSPPHTSVAPDLTKEEKIAAGKEVTGKEAKSGKGDK